jgi:hypothetical protein
MDQKQERNKMSKFNTCLRNGFVSFGDDFDVVAEVTHLFGMKATKLPYHNCFKIPGKKDVIACLFSEEGGDGWHNVPNYGPTVDSKGWNEIVTLLEFNDNREKSVKRINNEISNPRTRYVFWREERDGARWYKFYGTFKIDEKATRATLDTDSPHVVYERTSKTAECLKAELQKVAPLSNDELVALKGTVIEFKLLDTIGFLADCGEEICGLVKVWPGMKLLVAEVDVYRDRIICTTQDESLLDAAREHIPVEKREDFKMILEFDVPILDIDNGFVKFGV